MFAKQVSPANHPFNAVLLSNVVYGRSATWRGKTQHQLNPLPVSADEMRQFPIALLPEPGGGGRCLAEDLGPAQSYRRYDQDYDIDT